MNTGKENLTAHLTCVDHAVTGESFELHYDEEFDMLVTHPRPESMDRYYDEETYISHTDANISITDRLYQAVKRVTLKNKLSRINTMNTRGRKLLDLGCGSGDFLLTCARDGWKTSGMEPIPYARLKAESKLKEFNTAIFKDIKDIDDSFDVISLWHVLEHVPDIETYLKFLKDHLNSDGRILVAVPNFKSHDARYYNSHWAAYDVPRHLWHFSETSLVKFFEKYQMTLDSVHPQIFDAFYVSLLSEKYKNGGMRYFHAFWRGLVSNLKAIRTKQYSSRLYVFKITE
jgi:2-polyprenyl-3-methyl-5-hydroxy-6-metoxy-1,4-benzoquinol methylase